MLEVSEPTASTLWFVQTELPGETPEAQYEHAARLQQFFDKWGYADTTRSYID